MSKPTMKKSLEAPRFENANALQVAGLREHYAPQDMLSIPLLWQRFAPHIGNIAGQVGGAAYGLCSAGFTVVTVPAQKYAVFARHDHVSKLFETLDAIHQWLPNSGLQAAGGTTETPDFFECYSEEFDPRTGMGGMEVWVPIEV